MDNSYDSPAEILLEHAPEQKFPWVNVALFSLTCLSTLLMGALLMALYTNSADDLSSFLRANSQIALRTADWTSIQFFHHGHSVWPRDGPLPDLPLLRHRRNAALFHSGADSRRHNGGVH